MRTSIIRLRCRFRVVTNTLPEKIRSIINLIPLLAIFTIGMMWPISTLNAKTNNIFSGKNIAAPHIYVENLDIFRVWEGGAVTQQDQNLERVRLGIVNFSKDFRLYIDVIKNKVHYPSYYELINASTKKIVMKISVFDIDSAEWYFSGNGVAYLYQQDVQLCGPWRTRKFIKSGSDLTEITQPLNYLGYETDVLTQTNLYESPNSSNIVATVMPESKVTVLGFVSWPKSMVGAAFLVKSGFGLTGWHIPLDNEKSGKLGIYTCN
jgi:hypothetical protein